jgi:crotonobetainyl-CoA hydratase
MTQQEAQPATSGLATRDDAPPVALFERRGPIALITLNRPHVLNAVNSEVCFLVGNALEELCNDPELRVGVITGAGRAFSAGGDLKEVAAGRPILASAHPEWGFAGLTEHEVTKPLIAAVNGFAVGGGTEIVLACDLAIADPEAKFGLPEVQRGLFAAAGGLLRLGAQLQPKHAADLLYTGRQVSAAEAQQLGLVNAVSAAGRVLDEALELAAVIARNSPLAVRTSKALLRVAAGRSDSDPELWALNRHHRRVVFDGDEAREGAAAFLEKREPSWRC